MNFTAPPEYSMTGSFKKNIQQMPSWDDASPGPIYNTARGSKTNTFSVGKSHRTPINYPHEVTPSPADYPRKPAPTQHPMSIGKSQLKQQQNKNPAPSWYRPSQTLTKSKTLTHQMGTKYPSIMDDVTENPGPGSYSTPRSMEILSKSKSVTDSKFNAAKRFKEQKYKGPGVGKYQINHNDPLIKRKLTFSKAQTKKPAQIFPGPSEYHIGSQFAHTIENQPGKTLSMRFKSTFESNDEAQMAFNSYFQNPQLTMTTKRNSQKFSFGKEQRILFKDNKLPGPTDYINDTIVPKNSPVTILPQSIRRQYNDTIDNPGPGHYSSQPKVGPSYSIGKSKSLAYLADTPGSGRYNIESKMLGESKGNAFGKSKRYNFVSNNVAGVGDYKIGDAKDKKGKLSFSKADRFAKQQPGKPGPGDYHVHSIIGYKNKHPSK